MSKQQISRVQARDQKDRMRQVAMVNKMKDEAVGPKWSFSALPARFKRMLQRILGISQF